MSLPLAEQLLLVHIRHVFEAHFDQLTRLFHRFSDLDGELIVIVAVEEGLFDVDVGHRVLDVPVSKDLFDVDDVFGPVVFHGGFPVA